jgi:hypothetical protein
VLPNENEGFDDEAADVRVVGSLMGRKGSTGESVDGNGAATLCPP